MEDALKKAIIWHVKPVLNRHGIIDCDRTEHIAYCVI